MSKPEWKLLTKKRGSSTQGIPPGKEDLAWVTNTVTLIYGQRDAVLVDTFLSEQQSRELVDWVVESGKNLTTIYVTHAHGDHFFGLKRLLDKFPNARAIATAPIVAAIQGLIKPEFMQSVWEPRFPGQLPTHRRSISSMRRGISDIINSARANTNSRKGLLNNCWPRPEATVSVMNWFQSMPAVLNLPPIGTA